MLMVIQHPTTIFNVLSSSTAIAVPLLRWRRLTMDTLAQSYHIAVSKINNNLSDYLPFA